MSNRIDLSADTWIENGWLYTTTRDVRSFWPGDVECTSSGGWRIPLTACREIYRYREGEPCVSFGPHHHLVFCLWPTTAKKRQDRGVIYLCRRAATVCDTAEQFRAFYDAIKPEDTNAE